MAGEEKLLAKLAICPVPSEGATAVTFRFTEADTANPCACVTSTE